MNSKMVNKKMMMGKFPDLSRKKIKSWLKKENLFYCGLYLIATTVIALMFSLLSTPHLKSFVVAVPPSLEPVYGSPRELITYQHPIVIGIAKLIASIFVALSIGKLIRGHFGFREFGVLIAGVMIAFAPAIYEIKKTDPDFAHGKLFSYRQLLELTNDAEANKVSDFIENITGKNLVSTPVADYVSAQIKIKNGYADVQQLKRVVENYQYGSLVDIVPEDVKYFIEMSAFQKPVTSDAIHYSQKKSNIAGIFNRIAVISFLCGLAFIISGCFVFFWSKMKIRRNKI